MDRLLQAFSQKGLLEVGGKPEFRIRKAKEDGGGTAFADYVWKPLVLIEMKKRGTDLARTYRELLWKYDGVPRETLRFTGQSLTIQFFARHH